jgi:hypothetical protein
MRKYAPLDAGTFARIGDILDDPVQTLEYGYRLFLGHCNATNHDV